MIPSTTEARIETSTKCNLACIFCPHNTQFTRKKEIMSLNMFCFIVDKLKSEEPVIDTITISGFGEAFLDNTLIDKIEYARQKDYKVNVLTNGTLLKSDIIKSLNELKIESIRISLHTVNKNYYKLITNYDKLEKVTNSIEEILKTDLDLILSCEIININKDDVTNIISKYEDRVALIEMWKPHNWVTAFDYREKKPNITTCGRPFNGPIQIQVDGTVNMCCFDFNGVLLLGDFMKNSLSEIFSDKPFKIIEDFHKGNCYENLICEVCDQRCNSSDNVVYNSKFKKEDRIKLTSTNYNKIG